MKRHAIFVDAGYVFAQGSVSLLGAKAPRLQLSLDEAVFIAQLRSMTQQRTPDIPLLRVYWYDGATNGPTVDHRAIASMQDVKLKLGLINNQGQQKEVDSLLITDMIDLARNQAICDATLVTGDTDVRIAVQIAQSFGVRVHLIGIEPSSASQSRALREEVDTVCEISRSDVSKFLRLSSTAATPAAPATATAAVLPSVPLVLAKPSIVGAGTTKRPAAALSPEAATLTSENQLEGAIDHFAAAIPAENLSRLLADLNATRQIPREYDGRLLATCGRVLSRKLTPDEARQMRKYFEQRLRALVEPM